LATTEDFSVVQKEGKRKVSRTVKHHNLDVIIAVGYRVNSKRATQFRIWATTILKEYIFKGYALNDERMKTGRNMTYFDELQERYAKYAFLSEYSTRKLRTFTQLVPIMTLMMRRPFYSLR